MTYAIRDGRLVDPDGNPFLSLGLNHTDETALKFPRNRDVWRERYGSRQSWIRDGVVADLRGWGFNTLGWTSEYIAGGWGEALDWFGDPIDLKHSEPWSAAELRGAGMPYVAQVRVAEIEDWNGHPAFRPLDDDFADSRRPSKPASTRRHWSSRSTKFKPSGRPRKPSSTLRPRRAPSPKQRSKPGSTRSATSGRP